MLLFWCFCLRIDPNVLIKVVSQYFFISVNWVMFLMMIVMMVIMLIIVIVLFMVTVLFMSN